MEIGIIGGGAFGLTASHDLSTRGADVTLFERTKNGGENSRRAAGIVYDAYTDELDVQIAKRSIERFRKFDSETEFEFVQTPYVWGATQEDEKSAKAIENQARKMLQLGLDVSVLDGSELEEEFPDINADDIEIGAVTHNSGRVKPEEYVGTMMRKVEKEGVEMKRGTKAGIDLEDTNPRVITSNSTFYFDSVVVSAGAHTKKVLSNAGIGIAMKPYRVQALVTQHDESLNVPMFYDATQGYYLRPYDNGVLAGDGSEKFESDPDSWDPNPDTAFVKDLSRKLKSRLSDPTFEIKKAWAGLCTATPDKNPLLGEIRENVYVATGWQGHGFMRSPGLSEILTEEVLDGQGIEEFSPDRFGGDEDFEIGEGMEIEAQVD
ncbi:MAG: FAD-dependent oxidoreductase [Halobacteria archaeon]|nr:FAD-dependent oxidoreductase [Halobacteria archaeon]